MLGYYKIEYVRSVCIFRSDVLNKMKHTKFILSCEFQFVTNTVAPYAGVARPQGSQTEEWASCHRTRVGKFCEKHNYFIP